MERDFEAPHYRGLDQVGSTTTCGGTRVAFPQDDELATESFGPLCLAVNGDLLCRKWRVQTGEAKGLEERMQGGGMRPINSCTKKGLKMVLR